MGHKHGPQWPSWLSLGTWIRQHCVLNSLARQSQQFFFVDEESNRPYSVHSAAGRVAQLLICFGYSTSSGSLRSVFSIVQGSESVSLLSKSEKTNSKDGKVVVMIHDKQQPK